MARSKTGFADDDFGKWFTVGAALILLGVLPKRWEKGLAVAAALWALLS